MAFFKLQDKPQVFQLTEQGLKGFGTPEELAAAGGDFSQVQELTQPFLRGLDQKTIFDLRTGEGFATPEQFFGAGGKQDFSNITVPNEIPHDAFSQNNALALSPSSSLSNVFQARLDALTQTTATLQSQRQQALTEFQKTAGKIEATGGATGGAAGQSRAELFKQALTEAGVPAASEALRPIQERTIQLSNEIRALQSTMESDIRKELAGQIITESQVQARVAQRTNEIIKPRQLELANTLAQQQLLEGRLTEARDLAKQAVDFEISDRKDNLERLKFFYEQNKETLKKIDAAQAKAIERQIEIQDFFIKEIQGEKKRIIDLMVANPTAGIKTTDTLDEAINKVAAVPAKQPKAAIKTVPWSIQAAEAGLVGLPQDQAEEVLFQQAQDEKISAKERAKASVRLNISQQIKETSSQELLKDADFIIDSLTAIPGHKALSRQEISLMVNDLLRPEFKEPSIFDIGFKETPGVIASGIKRLFGR